MEKVSVITVTYNSGDAIIRTFTSILEQTYRPLEYVIVDGGSTDGTRTIIEGYLPRFQEAGIEVKYISEPDRGISDAFNKGIGLSTGSIIGITNADDMLMPDILQFIVKNFPENIDVYYGNIIWEDLEKDITYVRKSSADLHDLKIRLKIIHPAAFVRKRAYDKHGVFDIQYRYCMDKELLARMQREGATFLYCDKLFARVSAGGVSDQNLKGVMAEGKKIALANGVNPIAVKFIFFKNYMKNKIKSDLKKIPFVTNYLVKTRKA